MRYTVFFFLALLSCQAFAHDWWIDLNQQTYSLHQGHAHSAHRGAALITYPPDIVKTVLCATPDATLKSLDHARAQPVTFSGKCDAVLVSLSSGYWTKTPWATKNLPKTGMAGVLKSWLSKESVKRINRWHAAAQKPFGKGLEVTPTSNPFKVNVGDKIIINVTLNGKPVENVPVAYQGNVRGTTDKAGRIALRIRQTGVQLISASLDTPLSDGKADTLIRTANLQFELTP